MDRTRNVDNNRKIGGSSDNSTSLLSNFVDYNRDSSKFDPVSARPAQNNAT